jgi:cyclase
MLSVRVMPCLLLRRRGLVKTVKFKDAAYIGDPINTVRIFNEMEVDELVFLDITASPESKAPQFDLIEEIANECFMPFGYGGGLRSVEEIHRLFDLGAEKAVLNTAAFTNPNLVAEAARRFGSQSIIVSIDARRNLWGRYQVHVNGGRENTKLDPAEYAVRMAGAGAGEILITSMDRDGTFSGYDLELTRQVAESVHVPVIACGGAGSTVDFQRAVREGHAAAVAAGSLFVYQGAHRAVLVNYPKPEVLRPLFDHP